MKKYNVIFLILILFFFTECCSKKSVETQSVGDQKRLKEKKITNKIYSASLFNISDISDINTYVEVSDNDNKEIIYKGSINSVVNIYFKGNDTLVLRSYKPTSSIQYEFKTKFKSLNIIKDTLITDEEYYKLTH